MNKIKDRILFLLGLAIISKVYLTNTIQLLGLSTILFLLTTLNWKNNNRLISYTLSIAAFLILSLAIF